MSEHEPIETPNEQAQVDEEDVEAHLSRGSIGAGLAAAALLAAPAGQAKPVPDEPYETGKIAQVRGAQAAKPKKAKAKKSASSETQVPRGKHVTE